MSTVRCPACTTTTPDPATTYRCSGCGLLLRWRSGAPVAGPLQLGLFGEAVPTDAPRARHRGAARTALSGGARSQSRVRSHQDVLAAVTELFHDEDGYTVEAIHRARRHLTGHSTADLHEAAFGAAFLLATTLRTLEASVPGSGLELLRSLGLTLAEVESGS